MQDSVKGEKNKMKRRINFKQALIGKIIHDILQLKPIHEPNNPKTQRESIFKKHTFSFIILRTPQDWIKDEKNKMNPKINPKQALMRKIIHGILQLKPIISP